MSSKKQALGTVQSMAGIGTAAPSGGVGIDLTLFDETGQMRPSKWLITAVVTSAPSDLFLWGLVMHVGGVDTPNDDQWGLHSGKYGQQAQGKIGTALAVGTHHIVVEDVGAYTHLFFTKSAGTVDVYLRPYIESDRGN